MKKILLTLLTLILSMTPISVMADANETDWKTAIETKQAAGYAFANEYDEAETFYTTTYLNMRKFPNINIGEVEAILKPNSEVKVIADFNGWSKIVEIDEITGEEKFLYVWNKYLSKEKQVNEYLGNFKLTAYCNCSSCCGKWAGGATASGVMPSAGRTVAMGGIAFGTKLLINGHVYTVEDRGTPYGHVDIYFNSHSEALQFGRRYADVYRVR